MIGFRGSNAVCEQPKRYPPQPPPEVHCGTPSIGTISKDHRRAQLIRELAVAWVRSDRAITASGPDAVGVAQRLANFADEVLGVMDGE